MTATPIEQTTISHSTLAYAHDPALNDPDSVEKWDPMELNPEERKAFISLLNAPGHEGAAFDHFLDAAPSFGHLFAYITILKEDIPQGCDSPDIRLFLKLFMERVCKRLTGFTSHPDKDNHQDILLHEDVQNCLLGIISNFHSCYKKNIWPDDSKEQLEYFLHPKGDDDVKIYGSVYDDGFIESYPKIGHVVLEYWLKYHALHVPDTGEEMASFVNKLRICVINEQFLSALTNTVSSLKPEKASALLTLVIKTPDLKNSLYRCPAFAIALLNCPFDSEVFSSYDDWLDLFEYALSKHFLNEEVLKQQMSLWGKQGGKHLHIFFRLYKGASTTFAKLLVPVASELFSSSVLVAFSDDKLKKGFDLLLSQGWFPSFSFSSPLFCAPLMQLMLKLIKKSLPFINSNALPWFSAIFREMPQMEREEQEDFLVIFKHIYTEQRNPQPFISYSSDYAMRLEQNPILLEGLIEEFPRSIYDLKNALPLGLAIAQAAALFFNPSNPSLQWRQRYVLLLDSLKLTNVEAKRHVGFAGKLAALITLKNNFNLVCSLLRHACILTKKGKIKTIYPYAASLLTRICLADAVQLGTEEVKICAAVLLDHRMRNIDNFGNVPSLFDHWKNVGQEMLNRIVEHSPELTGLPTVYWGMIMQSAEKRISKMIKNSMQGKEAETASFLKAFTLCIIQYDENMIKEMRYQNLLESFRELNLHGYGKIVKASLSSLISDPNLLKGIQSGQVKNVGLLVNLLNQHYCDLDEPQQHLLYKAWKKHVAYLSKDEQIIFPLRHLHACQKILVYIAKNPDHFKRHNQQIELFLKEFSRRFPGKASTDDLTKKDKNNEQ